MIKFEEFDVFSAFSAWFAAVDGGLEAVDRLAESDPDYGTPRQILRDALAWSAEIADHDRRSEYYTKTCAVLRELDARDAAQAVRQGTDAIRRLAALQPGCGPDTVFDLLEEAEDYARRQQDGELVEEVRRVRAVIAAAGGVR